VSARPDTPTPIIATVWRYNGRRYLQKRAAFMAAARDALRGQDDPGDLKARALATEMAKAADRSVRASA
jgi:hypothetical protein